MIPTRPDTGLWKTSGKSRVTCYANRRGTFTRSATDGRLVQLGQHAVE